MPDDRTMRDEPEPGLDDLLHPDMVERLRPPSIVGWIGGALVVALLAAAVVAAVSRSGADPTSEAETTTTAAPVLLVANGEPGRPLIHPARLPAGLTLCEKQPGRPTTGDRFCDPTDPTRWIDISLVDSRIRPGELTPGQALAGNAPSGDVNLAIAVSGQYTLGFTTSNVQGSLVPSVLESIPAVGGRADLLGAPESPPPNPLPLETLIELLGTTDTGIYYAADDATLLFRASGFTLSSDAVAAVPVWDFIVGPLDAMIDDAGDHLMVFGRPESGDATGLVVWVQRSRVWRLGGPLTGEDLLPRARAVEAAIDDLR
jgi:hypothetical protein